MSSSIAITGGISGDPSTLFYLQARSKVVEIVKSGAKGINFDLEIPLQVTNVPSVYDTSADPWDCHSCETCSTPAVECGSCGGRAYVVTASPAASRQSSQLVCALSCDKTKLADCNVQYDSRRLGLRKRLTMLQSWRRPPISYTLPCLVPVCLLMCPGHHLMWMGGTMTGTDWQLLQTYCSSWPMTHSLR